MSNPDHTEESLPWQEVQAVGLYCEDVLRKLGLGDWGVGISLEQSDEGTHAMINSHPGKRFASLHLGPKWHLNTTDAKRRTLLHEMLHIAHFRQGHAIRAALATAPQRFKDAVEEAHWLESEYMVDGLTFALTSLPGFLPAWPNKARIDKSTFNNEER